MHGRLSKRNFNTSPSLPPNYMHTGLTCIVCNKMSGGDVVSKQVCQALRAAMTNLFILRENLGKLCSTVSWSETHVGRQGCSDGGTEVLGCGQCLKCKMVFWNWILSLCNLVLYPGWQCQNWGGFWGNILLASKNSVPVQWGVMCNGTEDNFRACC